MKKTIFALGLATLAVPALAATSFFAPLDVQKMHDIEIGREIKGEAPHFAVPHSIEINALADKSWSEENGVMTWTHRVSAPSSVSLNFGFSKFYLSPNARLVVRSADFSEAIRPFTANDNNSARELWTPVIMSDDVVIELTVPASEAAQVELELGTVGQGFRTFAQKTTKAGSCNVDVACSESQGWEDEVNAVAVISRGGSTFCTGFMVNNTAEDRTPFFMTADHCGITASNAASLVTYWNYQTSTCGGARDGKLNQFTTGSQYLAGSKKSDFTLVKLNKQPEAAWGVTYAGWDRSGVDATSAVAIHHPATDEKSISFENDPTTATMYLKEEIVPNATHVRITNWDKGTTEPGSSGSPLFDQDHRVIGQLHGGYASCTSKTSDWYGRFHVSWEGEGRSNNRLKDHLDAGNRGSLVTDTLR